MSAIAAIDPNLAQFLAGAAEARQQQTRPLAILDRSDGDDDGQQQTLGVDQDMAFPAIDLFPGVVAPLTWDVGRLDALGIQTARRRMFVPTGLLTYLGAQRLVQPQPDAVVPPGSKIAIDTGPLGEVMRQQPPLNAADRDIQHGIDDLAHVQRSMSPARLFWRDEIFEQVPLLVSEIGRIGISIHPFRLTATERIVKKLLKQSLRARAC